MGRQTVLAKRTGIFVTTNSLYSINMYVASEEYKI